MTRRKPPDPWTVTNVERRPLPIPDEQILWTLQKQGHTVVGVLRFYEHGIEFVVRLDGELHRSQIYRFDQESGLNQQAAETRAAWMARGWREQE